MYLMYTCLDTFSDMLIGIAMHNVDCGKHCAVDEALIYRPFSRTFALFGQTFDPLENGCSTCIKYNYFSSGNKYLHS